MWNQEVEQVWRQLSEEIILEVKEWRLGHPTATFKEIEGAVDGCWARARARILQDVAMASSAVKVSSDPKDERPPCPGCGHAVESRGQRTRGLTTNYDQSINLKRSYGVCPACGTGFFPPG